jgi:mRNA degradation ribonuclease J1/J2
MYHKEARKDMNVNENEILSSFTLRQRDVKSMNSTFIAVLHFTITLSSSIMNIGHTIKWDLKGLAVARGSLLLLINATSEQVNEKLEDIKKDRQIQWSKEKGQTEKQLSTIYYTENQRSSNTNPTKNWVWTQVLQMGCQFLVHIKNNTNT